MNERSRMARALGNGALAVAVLILVLDELGPGATSWVTPAVIALAVAGSGLRIEAVLHERDRGGP